MTRRPVATGAKTAARTRRVLCRLSGITGRGPGRVNTLSVLFDVRFR